MNKERLLIWLVMGVIALVLQLWVSPLFEIYIIRPDFIMIYVVLFGLAFDRRLAIIAGFSMGALQDFIAAGSFLGLSMLTKTLTGYLSGQLKKQIQKSNPIFSSLFLLMIGGFHFLIYLWFYFRNLDLSFIMLILRYVIPFTFYNGFFLLIIYFMLRPEEE